MTNRSDASAPAAATGPLARCCFAREGGVGTEARGTTGLDELRALRESVTPLCFRVKGESADGAVIHGAAVADEQRQSEPPV